MSENEERAPNRKADGGRPNRAPEESGQAAAGSGKGSGGPLEPAIAALDRLSDVARGVLAKTSTLAEIPTAQGPRPKKTGRAADLDMESEEDAAVRQRWGTLLVGCAFVAAVAGGIGFLATYWTGGSNLLLGGMLALCLGGFGAALVFSAHWLMPHKLAIEPREKLPSSSAAREASLETFTEGVHEVRRRSMLKWMGAAGAGLIAAIVVSFLKSMAAPPEDSLYSTVWKRGQRLMTVGGRPINVDSLQPGNSVTVFPEDSLGSEKTQTVLVRVPEQLLQLPKGRGNWAPMGYVAYSRICTHAGCPVGMFESEENLLVCPCHQSTFDVLRGAPPTSGPAARALPQLPLYADSEGNLRAAGGFNEPPGPGFWGMPS